MSATSIERPKLRADLNPADVLVWVDPREQKPYHGRPLTFELHTLDTGDYALATCPDLLRIQRKELSDFVACCGVERERFMREMTRMKAFAIPIVLVEATWEQLAAGEWRSHTTPASVMGTAIGLLADGINVICGGHRSHCEELCKKILYTAARRRWREAREWVNSICSEAEGE
jgi:ERCC4-type nuclease